LSEIRQIRHTIGTKRSSRIIFLRTETAAKRSGSGKGQPGGSADGPQGKRLQIGPFQPGRAGRFAQEEPLFIAFQNGGDARADLGIRLPKPVDDLAQQRLVNPHHLRQAVLADSRFPQLQLQIWIHSYASGFSIGCASRTSISAATDRDSSVTDTTSRV